MLFEGRNRGGIHLAREICIGKITEPEQQALQGYSSLSLNALQGCKIRAQNVFGVTGCGHHPLCLCG